MNGTRSRMASHIRQPAQREGGRGDPRQRERRAICLLITLAAIALPVPALAETCAVLRPNWTPGAPATALQEAIHLMTRLPMLVLLFASLLVVFKRHHWGALAVVVMWSLLVSIVTFVKDPFVTEAIVAEGCIGSPALFIGAVTAICTAMILLTLPRETRL